jgi:hypothetical protein
VQTRLNERMIEQVIVFATGHKREPSHIREHCPIPILSVEPQQGAFLWEPIGSQILTNGRKPLAQFLPIAPVSPTPETAEPLIAMRLRNGCPCSDDFPPLAARVSRCTHVIQSTKRRGQIVSLG